MMLFQNDLIPEEAFFNFLKTRKWLLDGVSICWGEPTLHRDLYDFAKKIKEMWFLVKLDTNGRDYLTLKRLIQDNIVDYVAIDIKHVLHRYHEAVGAQQPDEFFYNYQRVLQLLLEGTIDYEYRTTVIKGMHTLEDIELMAQYIRGAKHYYLQNYVGGNTLDPDFGGQAFTEEELRDMQKIAAKYVAECQIRK